MNDRFDELIIAKASTLLIGIFGIASALFTQNVISLVVYSLVVWSVTVVIPFAYGVMGFKTYNTAFKTACALGISCYIASSLTLPNEYTFFAPLFGIAGNGVSFFALSYILMIEKHNFRQNIATRV
jgi:hypothetical protein